jgi:CheY-like chemotaxis protein
LPVGRRIALRFLRGHSPIRALLKGRSPLEPYILQSQTTSSLIDAISTRSVDSLWRCRVLVVDDDEIVRAALTSLLKRSGYDVACAASGEEALRMLGAASYQVLLTDWQMPDMDGLELCRQVRLGYQKGDVYLIILTMRNQEHDKQLALAAGADDYIFKGAAPATILERLQAARAAK